MINVNFSSSQFTVALFANVNGPFGFRVEWNTDSCQSGKPMLSLILYGLDSI